MFQAISLRFQLSNVTAGALQHWPKAKKRQPRKAAKSQEKAQDALTQGQLHHACMGI